MHITTAGIEPHRAIVLQPAILIVVARVFEPGPILDVLPKKHASPVGKIHRRIKRFMIRFAQQGL